MNRIMYKVLAVILLLAIASIPVVVGVFKWFAYFQRFPHAAWWSFFFQ